MPVIRSLVMNELMTGKVSKTIRLVELLYIYVHTHNVVQFSSLASLFSHHIAVSIRHDAQVANLCILLYAYCVQAAVLGGSFHQWNHVQVGGKIQVYSSEIGELRHKDTGPIPQSNPAISWCQNPKSIPLTPFVGPISPRYPVIEAYSIPDACFMGDSHTHFVRYTNTQIVNSYSDNRCYPVSCQILFPENS